MNQYNEYMNYLNDKLNLLKGEKVNKKKVISEEESNFCLEDNVGERMVYIKEWKKKLENEKNSL